MDLAIKGKEVCTRVFKIIIEYIRETKGDETLVDDILNRISLSKDDYKNANHWESREQLLTLFDIVKGMFDEKDILFYIGQKSIDFKKVGLLLSILRPMSGPAKLYNLVPQYDKKFIRYSKFKIIHNGDNFVTYQMQFSEGYSLLKEDVDFIKGVLSCLPTIWGYDLAEITEIETHYEERRTVIRCDWKEQ
ncbi:MAG: hypothetical protein ACLFP2_04975 [Candidatus Woesearchaeota archaeon]